MITLYKEKNFTGDNKSFMNSQINNYNTELINATYKSLQVEALDKEYDSYPTKKFTSYTNPTPIITDILSSSQCADLCINSNCSAAVFNSSLNTCSVYNTPGILDTGILEDETIIPANKRKQLIINELNANLKSLMLQIKQNTTTVLQDNELSLEQNQITLDQYNLNKQQIQQLQNYLEEERQEFNSLETEVNNSSTIIMKHVNLYYIMWVFLIFLIFMILKNIFMPNNSNSDKVFWIILIVCIILASYNIYNSYGYLLWCILILIFVLKIILPRI
jgi:hypothetical protein